MVPFQLINNQNTIKEGNPLHRVSVNKSFCKPFLTPHPFDPASVKHQLPTFPQRKAKRQFADHRIPELSASGDVV